MNTFHDAAFRSYRTSSVVPTLSNSLRSVIGEKGVLKLITCFEVSVVNTGVQVVWWSAQSLPKRRDVGSNLSPGGSFFATHSRNLGT